MSNYEYHPTHPWFQGKFEPNRATKTKTPRKYKRDDDTTVGAPGELTLLHKQAMDGRVSKQGGPRNTADCHHLVPAHISWAVMT